MSSSHNPSSSVGGHTPIPAPIPSSLVSQATWDKIEDMRLRWECPGLSFTVVTSPKVDWSGLGEWRTEFKGFGIAALRADGSAAPITEDTLFPIGSCTKTITALYFQRLIENGVRLPGRHREPFTMDTKIKDILPEWRLKDSEATRSVTVEDLLSMVFGVSGHVSALRYNATPREAMETLKHLKPFDKPRKRYCYSNIAYQIAPLITEALTGRNFIDDVTSSFLDPLHMTDTTYSLAQALRTGRLAEGFSRVGEHVGTLTELGMATKEPDDIAKGLVKRLGQGPMKADEWCDNGLAGWLGLITSHKDAVKLLQAYLGEGSVISIDSLRENRMSRVVNRRYRQPNGEVVPTGTYGLGQSMTWRVDPEDPAFRETVYSHGGSLPGYESRITQIEDRIAIAAFSNDGKLGNNLLKAAIEMIYSDLTGKFQQLDKESLSCHKLRREYGRSASQGSPPDVNQLVGRYHDSGYGDFELRKPTTSERDQVLLDGVPESIQSGSPESTLIGHFHPSSVAGSDIVFHHLDGILFSATQLRAVTAQQADGQEDTFVIWHETNYSELTPEEVRFTSNFWNLDTVQTKSADERKCQLSLRRIGLGDSSNRGIHGNHGRRSGRH